VSFAYRRGRSVKAAALRIKNLRDRGYRYLADVDIDDFFNQIDHALLLAKISAVVAYPAVLRLFNLWIKAEIYDGEKLYPLNKGIPQGAVVSPLLANLFLDELDEALIYRGYQMVRYADDLVILTKSSEEARTALTDTADILASLHLAIDNEDSGLADFEHGFKFLGLIFLQDSILAPFDRPPRERRVLYYPPPFDLLRYLARKRASP
jgi:retron-type reverse transcriptase